MMAALPPLRSAMITVGALSSVLLAAHASAQEAPFKLDAAASAAADATAARSDAKASEGAEDDSEGARQLGLTEAPKMEQSRAVEVATFNDVEISTLDTPVGPDGGAADAVSEEKGPPAGERR